MNLRTAPIPRYSWVTHTQGLTLIVLFAVALVLPFLGCVFGWQGPVLAENRKLASWPDVRNSRIKDLPAQIEAWYDDHIGFRRSVIRFSGEVLHRFFRIASDDVIIGKATAAGEDPWYFYADEDILEDRSASETSLTSSSKHGEEHSTRAPPGCVVSASRTCLSSCPRKARSIPNCFRIIFNRAAA